jgi:hypothetical protein
MLKPLVLACRSTELAQPNALDDDCDGSIDGLDRQAALTVAWASAAGAELDLTLVDAAGNAIAAQRDQLAAACDVDGAARASSRSYEPLPEGAKQLVLHQVRPCAAKQTVQAVVSLGTPGQSRSFTVAIEPDKPLVVAELVPAVPSPPRAEPPPLAR